MDEQGSPLDALACEAARRLRERTERYRHERESEVAAWLRGLLELTIETAHGAAGAEDHPAKAALDAFVIASAERRFNGPEVAVAFLEAAAAFERVAGADGLPAAAALKPALQGIELSALAGFLARQRELRATDGQLFAALLEALHEPLIVTDASDRVARQVSGCGRSSASAATTWSVTVCVRS